MRLTYLAILVFAFSPAGAQRPTTAADARRILSVLAADSMEGQAIDSTNA